MNRNANARFSQVPVDIDIQRSRFDRSHDHKTTFNAGELIPFYVDEVLPGDTFDMNTNFICRMSTPIFPVMDNAYLDTFYFFVPNRLIWEHWEAFNGQNDETYWTQPTEYNVPSLSFPREGGWDKGSLADYFGLPTGISSSTVSVSALPFRAYVKIWNDWFRDQNYMNPAYFSVDDSNRVGRKRSDYDTLDGGIESALYGGRPLQVSKFHDYFTSVLPAPQKGPGVKVSVSTAAALPVVTDPLDRVIGSRDPLRFVTSTDQSTVYGSNFYRNFVLQGNDRSYGGVTAKAQPRDSEQSLSSLNLVPSNLVALTSQGSLGILVNDMRLAFQLQRLYEKDARGGTRYIEILKAHFGVESPDGRLQRSEYLGGQRTPINVNQVLQQSATDPNGESSPLGSTGAYSLTHHSSDSFVKSFTEHGWIIGVCCVRTSQSYQQGVNRMWSRRRRFDFYWPALANIGEQAVLKKEIYMAPGYEGSTVFDQAFGYQEAWAEYRYHPNIISGAFRSNYAQSLDAWHYGSDFNGDPNTFVADETFMYESPVNVDRTLAVQSSLEDQFIADFYLKCMVTRPMPLYSVPGLIDHH